MPLPTRKMSSSGLAPTVRTYPVVGHDPGEGVVELAAGEPVGRASLHRPIAKHVIPRWPGELGRPRDAVAVAGVERTAPPPPELGPFDELEEQRSLSPRRRDAERSRW